NILATAKADNVRHQVLTVETDHRLDPDLLEHPDFLPLAVGIPQPLDPAIEIVDHGISFCSLAGQLPQARQFHGDISDTAWLLHIDLQPKRFQTCHDLLAVAAAPDNYQIRSQPQQNLVVDGAAAAQPQDVLRGGGIIAPLNSGDNALTGTDGKQLFGDMGAEADDALCRAVEHQRLAVGIHHGNVRCGDR